MGDYKNDTRSNKYLPTTSKLEDNPKSVSDIESCYPSYSWEFDHSDNFAEETYDREVKQSGSGLTTKFLLENADELCNS